QLHRNALRLGCRLFVAHQALLSLLSLALAASTSRMRVGAWGRGEPIKISADAAMSSTARSNAASFALDGCVKPLSLRTNCSDASRISALVAGGSKLKSVFMLRHMAIPVGLGLGCVANHFDVVPVRTEDKSC